MIRVRGFSIQGGVVGVGKESHVHTEKQDPFSCLSLWIAVVPQGTWSSMGTSSLFS